VMMKLTSLSDCCESCLSATEWGLILQYSVSLANGAQRKL